MCQLLAYSFGENCFNLRRAPVRDVTTDLLSTHSRFFFAEVLKYLYLTFEDPRVISLDQFVFNTECHRMSTLICLTRRLRLTIDCSDAGSVWNWRRRQLLDSYCVLFFHCISGPCQVGFYYKHRSFHIHQNTPWWANQEPPPIQ